MVIINRKRARISGNACYTAACGNGLRKRGCALIHRAGEWPRKVAEVWIVTLKRSSVGFHPVPQLPNIGAQKRVAYLGNPPHTHTSK